MAINDNTDCTFCLIRNECNSPIKLQDTILLDAGSAYVLPSLGALVEGHVLVVTTQHHSSMRYASPVERKAVEQCIEEARSIYGDNILISEHGGHSGQLGSPCIDHAHVHLFPRLAHLGLTTLLDIPVLSQTPAHWLDNIGQLTEPYIWTAGRGTVTTYDSSGADRQRVRKAVAEHLGLREWDWALIDDLAVTARTVERWTRYADRP